MSGDHAAAAPAERAPRRAEEHAVSWLAQEWGVISSLWWRDLLRLARERSRWIGVLAQPVLFWVMLGSGLAETFRMPGGGPSYLTYFYPGVLVMTVLFTAIFGTISVIEDRQLGFLQAVLVAPGSRGALVLGKTAGVTTMALIQTAILLGAAPLAGYSFGQVSWPALLLVLLLGSVTLTTLSFSMAWVMSSTQGYHAVMSVVLIPLWMVSGAMFPAPASWMGVVVRFNPISYIVSGVRAALAGPGAPTRGPGLGTSLLVLGALSLAGFALAVLATRRGGARRE
ncbi:MAG: ABC transporter permease [Deltaproteobacteria bacterium]|nr:ABC transporter permease [Deltaproteobacteria bacterium]